MFPIIQQNQWREAETVVTFPQHGILNMKGQLAWWGRVALKSSTEQTQTKYCNMYQADPRAAFRGHLNVKGVEATGKKRYTVQSLIDILLLLLNSRRAALQLVGRFYKPY